MASFYLVIIYYNYDTQDNMKGDFIMRYRCIGKYEYSWKDVDEDGNEINYSEKVAILISNIDYNTMSNIGFWTEMYKDAEEGLCIEIKGVKTCKVNNDRDIKVYFNDHERPIDIDITLLGYQNHIPQLHIYNRGDAGSTVIPLYKEREEPSRTTIIVLSYKGDTTDLEIDYHSLEKIHELISINGDYSVFEPGDVFEIDINDYYDRMSLYDPKTEEMLPMVYVNGNWFEPVFKEKEVIE